jgi:hypothetical protein
MVMEEYRGVKNAQELALSITILHAIQVRKLDPADRRKPGDEFCSFLNLQSLV